jgi:hypothetical protein
VKDRPQEQRPSAVSERAPQDGEIRARWAWVEPEVWTERMLATLETGIEGGKWFRLIDKVWSTKNLGRSLEKVVAKGGSAGIDNQSARELEAHKDQTIAKLEQELRASQYQPQAVKRVWIPKPEKIADGRVLKLLEQMLQAGVMDSAKGWQPTEQGTPQGAVISPMLSNIYLNGLDWQMAKGGFEMVRYADDFIVLCNSQEQAQEALERVRRWVEDNGLSLHPIKTRLVDASQAGGFDFLGYHFERGMKWPRKKSMGKLKDTIRTKTRRTDGRSLKAICEDLNRTLRGWFGYFKHSKDNVFESVDGYTRGRLRSIL